MLKIKQFVFNPFGVNTYIVYDSDTKDAIVVDPGMVNERERKTFDDYIADNELKLQQIVNTHLHLDHCFGDNYVRDRYGVKVAAHVSDAPLGDNIGIQARQFGIQGVEDNPVRIDVPLKEGDKISVGEYSIDVLHVPGHSPGSLVLYSAAGNFAIVGDVLFRGSIGRTDLPGGDHATLINGIKTKLLTLPDSTWIFPGHDSHTDVGTEKAVNPYLR